MSEHLEILYEASRHLPEGTVLLSLYSTSSCKLLYKHTGKQIRISMQTKLTTYGAHVLSREVSN